MIYQNKKAVSDVITTVLIILLVLAAVAIIGGILLKNIGQAGGKIETQTACIDLDVKPTDCNLVVTGTGTSAVTTADVFVERGGRGNDANINEVTLLFDNNGVVTPSKKVINVNNPLNPLENKKFGSISVAEAGGLTISTKVRVAVQVTGSDGKGSLCEPSLEMVTCS